MTDVPIRKDPQLEIDAELLAEAQRQLGLATPIEAINASLRRLVEEERARRHRALEQLQQMSDDGLFDYSALDEVDR